MFHFKVKVENHESNASEVADSVN